MVVLEGKRWSVCMCVCVCMRLCVCACVVSERVRERVCQSNLRCRGIPHELKAWTEPVNHVMINCSGAYKNDVAIVKNSTTTIVTSYQSRPICLKWKWVLPIPQRKKGWGEEKKRKRPFRFTRLVGVRVQTVPSLRMPSCLLPSANDQIISLNGEKKSERKVKGVRPEGGGEREREKGDGEIANQIEF